MFLEIDILSVSLTPERRIGMVVTTSTLIQGILSILGFVNKAAPHWILKLIGITCVFYTLFFILCRAVANRHLATRTSSWRNPESYEYQLATAKRESEVQFVRIQPATVA